MTRPNLAAFWHGVRRPWADAPPPVPESRWLVAASYAGFPLISLCVALAGLQVASVDEITQAPLLNYHDGDTLLIIPMVKDAVERGSHWHNDRMGAPGEFQLYDFPVVDHLHFAALWLVGQAVGSYVTAFNVYFLLTYPLTTLTALGVLRHFRLSLPAAGVGGLLYTFLYYHAGRSQSHYFLAAYWVIPLSMLLVIRLARGEAPLAALVDGEWRWRLLRPASLAALAVAVLSGLGGAYYAFFTCAMLGFAGVYGAVAARGWKPAASAAILLGVVVATGLAAHAPAIAFQITHGPNGVPSRRTATEAEAYGLKIGHLLMPQPDHQCEPVSRLAMAYHEESRPVPSENRLAPLGAFGSAGLLAAGFAFMMPGPRRWPYGTLGALAVFAILLSTIGGFGALFNFFITPQVRAYSRMSVFIAFFALFASVWTVDRWFGARPGVRWAAFAVIAAVGVADQTPRPWFQPEIAEARVKIAEQYASDAAFFAEVEEAVPGEMVFALPHIAYPESQPRERMSSPYRFAAGYLHTRTVRWSFGAMKARETDQWLADVADDPVPQMARRLVAAGFGAACVDLDGYTEAEGARLVAEFAALCGPTRARQSDGSRVLFDLRPYRARLVAAEGAAALSRRGEEDREAVRLLFTDNFHYPGRFDFLGRARCGGVAVNPSDRSKAVRVCFRHTWGEGMNADDKVLKITSDFGWEETIEGRNDERSCRMITVPPGKHHFEFRCVRRYDWFPGLDSRICFGLWELSVEAP